MASIYRTETRKSSWLAWTLALVALVGLWWLAAMSLPQFSLGWLASSQAAWYLSRAGGTVAYMLLAASMIWGLLLKTRLVARAVQPATALAMHNYLSWTAIGTVFFHAVALLFDHYYAFRPVDLLVPFIGPYSPLWVGLGIIGLYLLALASSTFFLRKQIGQKRWRALHYLTYAAFLLTTLHGWLAGTDQAQLAVMYVAAGLVTLFLTIYRALSAATAKSSAAG